MLGHNLTDSDLFIINFSFFNPSALLIVKIQYPILVSE